MGLFDLVDVGLCRWWDCLIWWMSSVGCGFVWFGGWFVLISVVVFFFFFEVCGSGCWWPLLPHGGWAGVGDEDDDDSDRDREEAIYYFNV